MAVVLLTDNHIYTFGHQVLSTLMVLIVIAITALLLLSAQFMQKKIGEYGITVISKIMGLILASYALQSILNGIREFFSTKPAF